MKGNTCRSKHCGAEKFTFWNADLKTTGWVRKETIAWTLPPPRVKAVKDMHGSSFSECGGTAESQKESEKRNGRRLSLLTMLMTSFVKRKRARWSR